MFARIILLTLLHTLPLVATAQTLQQVLHVKTELIASHSTITPGETLELGWRVVPESGWHIYWKNPGDSGLPAQVDWLSPPPITFGELQYPVPHKINVQPLISYGYEEPVVFLTQANIPANTPAGNLNIQAKVGFLMCKDICLPGEATLTKTITIGTNMVVDEYAAPFLAQAKQSLPTPLTNEILHVSYAKGVYSLWLEPTAARQNWLFIPNAENVIDDPAAQTLSGNEISIPADPQHIQAKENLGGLLINTQTNRALAFELPVVQVLESTMHTDTPQPTAQQTPPNDTAVSLLVALLFAFIGGLILNLMPCVLPVVALKVLALVKHTQGRYLHAASFTAGILASFWALAFVIEILKSAGAHIGWGFQLQEPIFVATLIMILILVAAQLMGVFELSITLSGKQKPVHPLIASFANGLLVVVLATPCTAPFMATAVAYGLTQGIVANLLVMTSMALGLSAPYVLLSSFPFLLKRLPKPGEWMNTFKELMAFPILATAVWLFYVVANQVSSIGALLVLLAALIVFIAAWVWGKKWALTLRLMLACLLLLVAAAAIVQLRTEMSVTSPNASAERWQAWSKTAETAALNSGQPVFVDFTADWCITCKVNTRTTLDRERVQSFFTQHNVALFKADWTRRDAAIADELARHNRQGVPLYLFYVPGKQVVVLPQILTPEATLATLEKALSP